MMRHLLITLLAVWSFAAVAQTEDDETSSPSFVRLQMSQVPDIVLASARKAKPNVYFNAAERTYWNDEPVYVLTGAQIGKEWKVYLGTQGQIKHISSDWRDKD